MMKNTATRRAVFCFFNDCSSLLLKFFIFLPERVVEHLPHLSVAVGYRRYRLFYGVFRIDFNFSPLCHEQDPVSEHKSLLYIVRDEDVIYKNPLNNTDKNMLIQNLKKMKYSIISTNINIITVLFAISDRFIFLLTLKLV